MAEKRVKLFSNMVMSGSFAVMNLLLVIMLIWTTNAEYDPEWKRYQRTYYELFAERTEDPELKKRILSTPLKVQQVWTPKLDITDRCMSCHMGASNPVMKDVPQPYKVHPEVTPGFNKHNFAIIGCVVCHEGQGSATTVHGAHIMHDLEERFGPYDAQHAGWERPLLPIEYVEASCQKCHNVMEGPIPGADHLNAGWQLAQEKGCKTCHYVIDSGAKQAPELSYSGTKFFNKSGYSDAFHDLRFGYLKESLRCPQANMDDTAKENCRAEFGAEVAAADSGASMSGDEIIQKYQCVSCHNLTAPVKGLGPSLYDIGKRHDEAYIRESIENPDKVIAEGFTGGVMKPMLSGAGFYNDVKANPGILDTLVTHLAGLKGGEAGADSAAAAAPAVVMPNFNFNDEELRNMVVWLLGLQEPTVLYPQHPFVEKSEGGAAAASAGGVAYAGKSGEEIFKQAGCVSCHKLDGPERVVGPSLWDIGAKQDKDSIRDSILWPDKVLVPGYPKGLMKTTLDGLGFYKQISVESLEKLVEYLAERKGKS